MSEAPQAILSHALAEAKAGRLAQATAIVEPHLQAEDVDLRLLRLAALLAERCGDMEKAAQWLGRIAARVPQDLEARFNLGVVEQQRGQYAPAIQSFRAVLEQQAAHPAAAMNLARCLLQVGRFQEARPVLEQAVALNPNEAWPQASLAAVLSTERDPSLLRQSEEHARRALALDSGLASAWDTLGVVLMKQGRDEQAIAAGEKAVSVHPQRADYIRHLADCLERGGYSAQAEAALQSGIANCEEPSALERQLGILQLRAGQPREALNHLNSRLATSPQDQRALAHKSVALKLLGHDDDYDQLIGRQRFLRAVQFTDVAPFADVAAFNLAFAQDIRNHPTLRFEPVGLAARGGSLTGELLDHPTPAIRVFERKLRRAVDEWRTALADEPEHPFVDTRPEAWRLNTWATLVPEQGEIASHIHEESWLSGAYYVALPEAINDVSQHGWIEFGRPGGDLPQLPADCLHQVKPEAGLLLLFPSYWFHRTLPFTGSGQRISVSFDIEPVNPVGAASSPRMAFQ